MKRLNLSGYGVYFLVGLIHFTLVFCIAAFKTHFTHLDINRKNELLRKGLNTILESQVELYLNFLSSLEEDLSKKTNTLSPLVLKDVLRKHHRFLFEKGLEEGWIEVIHEKTYDRFNINGSILQLIPSQLKEILENYSQPLRSDVNATMNILGQYNEPWKTKTLFLVKKLNAHGRYLSLRLPLSQAVPINMHESIKNVHIKYETDNTVEIQLNNGRTYRDTLKKNITEIWAQTSIYLLLVCLVFYIYRRSLLKRLSLLHDGSNDNFNQLNLEKSFAEFKSLNQLILQLKAKEKCLNEKLGELEEKEKNLFKQEEITTILQSEKTLYAKSKKLYDILLVTIYDRIFELSTAIQEASRLLIEDEHKVKITALTLHQKQNLLTLINEKSKDILCASLDKARPFMLVEAIASILQILQYEIFSKNITLTTNTASLADTEIVTDEVAFKIFLIAHLKSLMYRNAAIDLHLTIDHEYSIASLSITLDCFNLSLKELQSINSTPQNNQDVFIRLIEEKQTTENILKVLGIRKDTIYRQNTNDDMGYSFAIPFRKTVEDKYFENTNYTGNVTKIY